MATTIRIPMALLTVDAGSGNAFWTNSGGTTVDFGHVGFIDGGVGVATYWATVPTNVAATPAWNLDYYCHGASNGASTAIVTARALAVNNNEVLDGTYTIVAQSGSYTVAAAGSLTIVAVSGGTFDTPVALAANDYLLVEVTRHGDATSDTVTGQWNLSTVLFKVDLT